MIHYKELDRWESEIIKIQVEKEKFDALPGFKKDKFLRDVIFFLCLIDYLS